MVKTLFAQIYIITKSHMKQKLQTSIKSTTKSFLVNKTVSLLKSGVLITLLLISLLATNKASAQIMNEGIEEPEWQSASANPNNSGTTSGSVFISATRANSVMTYYLCTNASSGTVSTTATTTGTKPTSSKSTVTFTSTDNNTCPNSGTWWYLRGLAVTDNRLSKAHSASHSWDLGGGGYLITPVVNGGVVTVSFWSSSSGVGNIFVGLNTATSNPPPQSYSTKSTFNGFTSGVQSIGINGTMQSYVYTTIMTAPAQVGFFSTFSSTSYIDDINITVNSGTQASVTTTAAVPTYTTAVVTGAITANNPAPNAYIVSSGVCYALSSVTNTPDISNKYTVDGPSGVVSASVSDTLKGLTPGSAYCSRVYAVTTVGIVYGNVICFTTKAAITPVISTNPINIISSVAATSGGNISDSGGLVITASGICWNTSGSPTINDNKTNEVKSGSFTSNLTSLVPCTKYYVRAYAINSLGITYGNELSFSTSCVAGIYGNPATLNFGNVPKGSSTVLSFTLTGALLSPAAGNITVTAPNGYLISYGGGNRNSSIIVPYTGGAISAVITVYFSPAGYGYYNDSIRFSGGGALVSNIQSVFVSGLGTQPVGTATNSGTDFWTGFGYVEEMSTNKANMSVYIAAGDQDAIVNVDIPGLGWSWGSLISIPAHTVFEVTGFPKAAPLDSRLYYTGISNRAIHVQSTNGVPVSVWTYTSASDNTAAGCLNIPTNTWDSRYVVQSFGGFSNNINPNSYFFVIAKDDSTIVTITPAADIVDSNANTVFKDNTATYVRYPAGIPFNVILNKGQVFNGISTLLGTGTGITTGKAFSADLSGTTVSTTFNKKIAVFGGNARCMIDTSTIPNPPNFQTVTASSGSDNLMQQMFPSSSWGTRYLAVPTKTMEDNYYRIYVQDSSANVTVNGILLSKSALYKNSYYQLSGSDLTLGDIKPYDSTGNHFFEISADQAISVNQFIVSGIISSASVGNNGKGDPEMIILSPVQQSINSVTVATPSFKNNLSGGNYINVVIPKNGVNSFSIYSDTTTLNWKAWKDSVTQLHILDSTKYPAFNPTDTVNLSKVSYKRFNDTIAMLVDTGASSYIAGVAYNSSSKLVYLNNAFQPYPSDSNYAFVKFKVAVGKSYTMYSDSGFNAIAYGMDAGESYGFNAGTNLVAKNIIQIPLQVSGNIIHPSKKVSIPSVTLKMSSSNSNSNNVISGYYEINNIQPASDILLTAYKNNDVNKTNGVTALDIALVQSHVLGKNMLNSPYKLIAADVTGDGKVTALDIVYMKRLILAIDTTFTYGAAKDKRLWSFVDSSYKFPDSTNPFPYKDSISYTGLNISKTNQTFYGCKLGDVNWDWNPAMARPMVNNENAVELSYPSVRPDRASDGYVHIPIKVKNFKEMLGMQFTINFDPTILQWQGLANNSLGLETGTTHANEGSVTFLWVDKQNNIKTLEDGSVLMDLVFNRPSSMVNCQLSIDGSVTAIAAYDKDYGMHNVVMKKVENIQPLLQEYWSVSPNPTNDGVIKVQMNLRDKKIIVFRLLDNTGRVQLVKQVEAVKGSNNITLKEGNIPSGVYYLQAIGIDGVKQLEIEN